MRNLTNCSLVLVVELVEAIGIIHQLQHLRLDTFSGAVASVTGLFQKRGLLSKRLENNRPLQDVEVVHIASSELALLSVKEELVQMPSCYQSGPPLRLVAAAIELALDEGGQLMAKVDQARDGNTGRLGTRTAQLLNDVAYPSAAHNPISPLTKSCIA